MATQNNKTTVAKTPAATEAADAKPAVLPKPVRRVTRKPAAKTAVKAVAKKTVARTSKVVAKVPAKVPAKAPTKAPVKAAVKTATPAPAAKTTRTVTRRTAVAKKALPAVVKQELTEKQMNRAHSQMQGVVDMMHNVVQASKSSNSGAVAAKAVKTIVDSWAPDDRNLMYKI